jgi:hypothetical protein
MTIRALPVFTVDPDARLTIIPRRSRWWIRMSHSATAASMASVLIVAVGASASSAQSQAPVLRVSVEPLGVWCDEVASLLIALRNDDPDIRWLGLRESDGATTAPLLTRFFSLQLDLGNRSIRAFGDGGGLVGPPAVGVILRRGDRITSTHQIGLLPPRQSLPDMPFTLRLDWEPEWFESPTGSSGDWERVEDQVTAFFRVEPIEGSECFVAQLEE